MRAVRPCLPRSTPASHAEALLREVLRVAYINPVGGHERSAYDLNLSRTTYFRKLRVALERVVTQMQA